MNVTTLNTTTLDGNVIIKKGGTPTPPSGGESTIEYLDVSGVSKSIRNALLQFVMLVKGHTTKGINNMEISATGMTPYYWNMVDTGTVADSVKAVAIDFTQKIEMNMGGNAQSITVKESFLQMGVSQTDIDSIPRITKEQFYSLD